ncbi:MAG: lipoprotein-releasing system transmembrane subunit LolC [Rhodospirillaceae bacterium]|nr:lipoprotein-releasing system transmembrane subunit LolC [Rhodospirillaceae bacterium]|tara:strand:- start:1602 stop:2843 length:1242 start_codon:yes stop_codon:yes gene_type:complete
MIRQLEFFISFRYLKSRRRENFISIVSAFSFFGITIGVAALIVVLAVQNGFRQELFSRVLGINPHVIITSNEGSIKNYKNLSENISLIKGIKSVFPIIDSQVMVKSNKKVAGALVRGITYDDIIKVEILNKNLILGNFNSIKLNEIIIGYRLARLLDIKLGDNVTILTSSVTSTAIGSIPRSKSYVVGGIFNIGMYEYDSTYIFLNLKNTMKLFNYDESVGFIDIRLNNPDDANVISQQINLILPNNYEMIDWKQLNSSYVNALKTEKNVMFLILTLIILVAAFNIVSGLVMLVKEKSRDIAILRTLGASKFTVMKIFFLSGTTIGIAGTSFGSIIGVLFAKNISSIQSFLEKFTGNNLFAAEVYFLSQLPAKIILADVISVICLSLFLSILATIYPSWKASRLEPVEVLRYE